ncbi:MAG TPA: hypothetical protein VHE80_09940 [Acidimicrobiales bacterium]|nr:hypothetical protein [Acidimicrobiales bacterium]
MRPRRHDENGQGVVATLFGVLVFVVLLLFAAQVLVGLYTTSVVTAATYDAARIVAGADAGMQGAARDDAEAGARRQLGRAGEDMKFAWAVDADAVRLTVRTGRPTLLPDALASGVGLGDIVRTVHVRTERVR